jgi:hypothetical protein
MHYASSSNKQPRLHNYHKILGCRPQVWQNRVLVNANICVNEEAPVLLKGQWNPIWMPGVFPEMRIQYKGLVPIDVLS